MKTTIVEYKSAAAALAVSEPDTMVYNFARDIVLDLANKEITYYIQCMLCKEKFEHHVKVQEAASYTDEPRGICAKH